MASHITVYDLKASGESRPLGLGCSPVFSWKLQSGQRAACQQAYRLIVRPSSAPGTVLWDTGRVESDENVGIPYGGPELQSGYRYEWQVMVWGRAGDDSGWSPAGWFEMGLLHSADWAGAWIGGKRTDSPLRHCRWITHPAAEIPHALFFREITLPNDRKIRQAWFDGTADDRFTLFVNHSTVAKSNPQWGQRFDAPFIWVDFASLLHPGANFLCCLAEKAEGKAAFIGRFRIVLDDGSRICVPTDENWRVTDASGCDARTFETAPAQPARVAAEFGAPPWGSFSRRGGAPLLRREFSLPEQPVSARLYICGLGYYTLTVNGRSPSDDVLHPAYTQYAKRVYYDTYDVTSLLRPGPNCIGVELGHGYYACGRDWTGPENWCGEPKLRLQMNGKYADGSVRHIESDTAWRTAAGPTVDDSVWYGEKYDAGAEKPGWDMPGYPDKDWEPAHTAEAPNGQLETCRMPPIRICEKIPCRLIGTPKPECRVYDAGRIVAGWAAVTLDEPRDARVRITYGERLRPDGTLDVWKDGQDGQFWETPQTDVFISAGNGEIRWAPRYSYKGFRYIQIEAPAAPCQVTALVFHNAVKPTGRFESANPLFDAIHQMVGHSILNNLHSIPTDTPMHEKRGWTGDSQVIAETACMNFDMHGFFVKWIQDMIDSQDESGAISHTCPGPLQLAPTPAWMSALLLIPWTLYLYYGDTDVLRRHYSAFRRYIGYELDRLQDGVSSDRYYNDWSTPEGARGPEGAALFATGYVCHACDVMAKIAAAVGKPEDAVTYRRASRRLHDTINRNFFNREQNVYHTEIACGYRQSSNVLPLAFGIVPAERAQPTADHLAQDVARRHDHLDTGCFGTKYLLPVLSAYGHADTAYRLANQRTFPSWGYWLENGATACLETWSLDARSLDHYFLGTVDEWFYSYVAGIRPTGPGFRTVRIRPYPCPADQSAGAILETVRGPIAADWHYEGRRFKLNVQLPPNVEAQIVLPDSQGKTVLESGRPVADAGGIREDAAENGCRTFTVASGIYRFTVRPAGQDCPEPTALSSDGGRN